MNTEPLIRPLDKHNQRLLDAVHPASWQNPEAADRYHLVVVGAGTAGLVAAAGAAGLGAKVALVERHLMGGDCLNFGCVPSKALISAARAWHQARSGGAIFGAPVPEPDATDDFAHVMERMRRLRADIGPHDGAQRFTELGIDVFLGSGRFVAEDAVEVDGQRLHFRRAVIATGGRAAVPPIPGIEDSGFLTNASIFELTSKPASLIVIGAGPIGCELAQAFARFGTAVTLVDRGQLLPREDPDAAEIVQRSLERDGVRLELNAQVKQVELTPEGQRKVQLERDGKSITVHGAELLLAAGRRPNVEGLGLEAAGVSFNPRGIQVDDTLRTSNSRIYAIGDVASPLQFTHVADAQARLVIRRALFPNLPFGGPKNSDLVVPWCTYTSPEIAHVGLYEADAEDRGIAVDTITVPLDATDRARLDGEGEGMLKIHVEKGKDRILGATLVAEHAGDLIAELTLAITAKVGLAQIAATIHPYPTQSEIVKRAADAWYRRKLTPSAKGWLERYFRWIR
ncbi:MAG: mercuric reductase [Acidobacteriota bacterium]